MAGPGSIAKTGTGTLILTAANSQGGIAINGGVVQISSDANLGATGATVSFDSGTLRAAGGTTIARSGMLNAGGGTIEVGGDPYDNAAFVTFSGVIAGAGGLNKTGSGSLLLTGNNSYTGATNVTGGFLFVDGDQIAATGPINVSGAGTRLSGNGIIGGDANLSGGASFGPAAEPNTPATLTINGNMNLGSDTVLLYNVIDTIVGGALNDLTNVRGNLVLDGRIDVVDEGQTLGPGVYRIINYDGTLTNNGLDIGSFTTAADTTTRPLTGLSVQTVIPGQVNLVNTSGLSLTYWDGDAGPKNDGLIQGGNGIWRHAGPAATANWTDPNGTVNAPWADGGFAIFSATPGTVTVSSDSGAVIASGMQFASSGYLVQGDSITLVGSPSAPSDAIVRVGDGTQEGAGITATISAALTGDVLLRKTDSGTLALTGTNSYTGGTVVEGGTVEIVTDANLGAASGRLLLNGGTLRAGADLIETRATVLGISNGTIETATAAGAPTTLEYATGIGGTGALTKTGSGTLLLTADSVYRGGTTISAGTLQLGNGGTAGGILGNIVDNARLVVNRSNQILLSGTISGTGSLEQVGTGTTVLSGANSYTGGTLISAGTLQLGNGGTNGSVVGTINDNATLAIDRSDQWTLNNQITGTGAVVHNGTGTTILTADNSYAGATIISSGFLYVDGDQGAATGSTSVAGGARLGGNGIVGGNVMVADNGTLAPGQMPSTAGTLAINGDLSLSASSLLAYNVVQANVAGGTLNDLTEVRGNLTLDGIVNVVDTGVPLGAGIYRLINYSGALTNNGLTIGSYSPDRVAPGNPISGFIVQTAVQGQVNLVSTSNLALTYWDGPTLPKDNNLIDGGTGTWRRGDSPTGDSNFTGPDGSVNAPWSAGGFAIFTGAPGTVTVDTEGGSILVSGMQFATDGYVVQGDALSLVGGRSTIRVGDGTDAGAGITATINAVLSGGTGIAKSDLGTLILGAANTFTGGVNINGGTLQISSDANLGAVDGRLTLNNGTLRTTADIAMTRPITIASDGGFFDVAPSTTLSIGSAIDGSGQLTKAGTGTLLLTADASYTGGTTIGAGTLQLGNGGTAGGVIGDIVDNGNLTVNRSNAFTIAGTISGTGTFAQAGTGTTILTADNSYTGGTTISAGTLQIGNGGTTGHIVGDILDNSILVVNRSDTKLTPGVISGTGQLIQAGTGTLILQADDSYTGGTTISAGTLQLGDGGTAGSIVGDVLDNGTLAFNRADDVTFAGSITGTGAMVHLGTGKTTLTGLNTYSGGTTISAGTVQVGDGGTTGTIYGDIVNNGVLILNRSDDLTYGGSVSGTGSAIKLGAGTFIATGTGTYTGGTTISEGVLQLGDGGTSGSVLGNIVDNAKLVVNRSDSLLLSGTISGTGSFEQAGTGTTLFEADNSYTGGTLISAGTLQVGNGGTTGLVPGDVVDNGKLVINRSNTKNLEGVVSGTGELIQAGLGTLIITRANSYSGGTAIEAGTLQISSDDNLGAPSGGLRIFNATLQTTADITTARDVTLSDLIGTMDTADGTTLTLDGLVSGAGGLNKAGGGTLILTGANSYAGATTVSAGMLRVNGDQTASIGLTTVNSGATLGGSGIIGGDVVIANGGILAPGNSPGTLTINGSLTLNGGSILNYEFGQANTVGGPLNDLTAVGGNLILDGTINVAVSAGGSFDPGIYRVINYAGTLTDNGLQIGTIPSASYYVQTSVANQVNLVNTAGLTLNYWDGAAGTRNDGVIAGGDGVWQNAPGNDNWTTMTGTPNAPWTDSAFAIFTAAPGTVTVDGSLGAVTASGMQFAVDGYRLQGDPVTLAGSAATPGISTIRVGDGTAAGAGYVATIDSVLTGAATLEKADLGTLILNGANSYAGGTQINAGVLQVSQDANLGAATGALGLDGGTLRSTASFSSARGVTLGTGGGTIETAASTTLSLGGSVGGAGALIKIGEGTLVLSGTNSYTGGTQINSGILQASSDANLGDAAGGVSFAGGTLHTTADLASDRTFTFTTNGTLLTDSGTTLTLNSALAGMGTFIKDGAGTLLIAGDSAGYPGTGRVAGGTLAVDGVLGGALAIEAAGRLEGTGQVGNVTNAGVVAPGRSGFGTLTVAGDYTGSGGTLEIETELAGDDSPTDRLVVTGGTQGSTQVTVIDRGGLGAPTVEGVKIIDVAGASNGAFTLNGDYQFDGQPAIIAGAYGYRLYKNGVADPADGDWYLRSSLTNPPGGGGESGGGGDGGGSIVPPPPLYQPGVPIYEAYPQTLLAMNGLPTLQQRVGNRSWAGANPQGGGIWGRMEGARDRPAALFSTSMADRDTDRWQAQIGADATLARRSDGSVLIAGIAAHYGKGSTDIRSLYGDGSIRSEGYGVSASLTWYGPKGFYIDSQAKFSWYDSDLRSGTTGWLAEGNGGTGKAFGVEVGKRSSLGGNFSITPQIQMIYSTVDFDRFTDPFGAVVSSSLADSLKTRWGVSIDHQQSLASGRRTHVYGLVNVSYEWLDGTRADVSGTPIANRDQRLWGELGLGGSYSWGRDRFTLYAEVSGNTALKDFGDSYSLKGTIGLRMGF